MRHVKASEAKEQFETLLKEVKGGETVTIDQDGIPIARIVPARQTASAEAPFERRMQVERTIANIREIAKRNGPITVEEILSARDEGRR
jgi:prevent-host-death family protein